MDDTGLDKVTGGASPDTSTATTVPTPVAITSNMTVNELLVTGMSCVLGHIKGESTRYHSLTFATAIPSVVAAGNTSGHIAPKDAAAGTHHNSHSSLIHYITRNLGVPTKIMSVLATTTSAANSTATTCTT